MPSFGPIEILLLLFILAIFIGYIALAVTAVVSIAGSYRLTGGGKALWIVMIIAFPFLGSIAWFIWGRKTPLER